MAQTAEHSIKACMIVAHPDDETLWGGGSLLLNSRWQWEIYTLCRASDPDRSAKFRRILSFYGASGDMADLDDGPEQHPLTIVEINRTVLEFTNQKQYDLIVTHGPRGEYTRHRRHEELSRAVCSLWLENRLRADELRMFAYEDGNGAYAPRAAAGAHLVLKIPDGIRQKKYQAITGIYGFTPESWEASVKPAAEAFWCFRSAARLKTWLKNEGGTV